MAGCISEAEVVDNSQRNLYNQSGNVIMRGTENYERERKAQSQVQSSLREELEGYTYEELLEYYRKDIDPDGTEDLTGLNEEDLIEKILEVVEGQSGGRRRRSRPITRRHKGCPKRLNKRCNRRYTRRLRRHYRKNRSRKVVV